MGWEQNEINRMQQLRRKFLNEAVLRHHAISTAPEVLSRERLAGIKSLHIIGMEDQYSIDIFPFMGRCYTDRNGEWLLLFEVDPEQLGRIITECAPGLEKLDIRCTNWRDVDLYPFGQLRSLELSDMNQLRRLDGLELCGGLETLSLSNVPLMGSLDVSDLHNLRSLKLRNTGLQNPILGIQKLNRLEQLHLQRVSRMEKLHLDGKQSLRHAVLQDLELDGICLDEPLEQLDQLEISRVPVSDVGFLRNMPNLKSLTLANTAVTVLPDLTAYSGLETLDLDRSPVREISGLPLQLHRLQLGNTGLKRIPDSVRKLRQLQWLDLSRLQLESLPAWLPELNPVIAVDEFYQDEDGIWLYGTTATGVDLTALLLPRGAAQRELTQQKTALWFGTREREEPSAVTEYQADHRALEFVMEFTSLPAGLVDRLWMKRWEETDRECTWAEGTRLVHGETGVSAVVFREGNVLKCFVRPSERSTRLHDHLSIIKEDVDAISRSMKLQCTDCRIIHKSADQRIAFSYEELLRRHRNGERQIPCGLMLFAPYIEDILNQNNRPVDQDRDKLLEELADIFATMQNNPGYRNMDEDGYTTGVRDALGWQGYVGRDQTIGGTSGNNGGRGRVDISISKPGKPNKAWTLYEALILTGKSPSQLKNWDEHLSRVMNNYNHKGLPFVLLASYVKCPMEKYREYFRVYMAHLSSCAPQGYCLCSAEEMNLDVPGYGKNEFVRVAMCTYRRVDCDDEQDGFIRTVYHFFARFGA